MLNVNAENAIEILMQEVKTDTSNAHKIYNYLFGSNIQLFKSF